jgi:hypothetical protein
MIPPDDLYSFTVKLRKTGKLTDLSSFTFTPLKGGVKVKVDITRGG